MEPYPLLYQLLDRHRRPSATLWQALCAVIRLRGYLHREIWVDRGEVPRCICLIQEGAALGWEYRDGAPRLSRVWKEGELILLAESGLTGQKSTVRVIFPVP